MICQDSYIIKDKSLIDRHFADPDFPYLISFPRTGSHWLRMLMELYFGKPSLLRVFYHQNYRCFTCLHHHDLALDVTRNRIIYLYRDPVNTIYSQMNYQREDLNDGKRVRYWADLYQRHLLKWLVNENFTTQKVTIRYEELESSVSVVFLQLCSFFKEEFNQAALDAAIRKVTYKEVKNKTRHDPQVINCLPDYQQQRKLFKEKFGLYIRETVWCLNIDN